MAMPGGVDMGAILSDQLMKAAAVVEDQIDAEMAKMEKLPDEDELEVKICQKIKIHMCIFIKGQIN